MKLTEIIKRAISNGEEYSELINNILDTIKTANQGNCKDVIGLIKKVIKDKHAMPSAKLRALNLFHACMMLNNYHFLMFAQKKVMSRFTILAKYRKERADDRKGEDIFGLQASEPEKDASAQFLKNLLQYIQIWASHFGRGPDGQPSMFYKSYNSLTKEQVQFAASNSINRSVSSNAIPVQNRAPAEPKPAKEIQKPQNRDSRSLKRRVEKEIGIASNTLELFQEMINTGADNEMISELIANIRSQKAQFESEIETLLSSGEEALVQRVLALNEQLQAALNIYKSSKDDVSEGITLKPNITKENRAKAQLDRSQKNKSDVDANLLDLKLDFGASRSDFSSLEFATQPPGRPSIEHNFHTSQMGFYGSPKIPNLKMSPERPIKGSPSDILAPMPIYMPPSPIPDLQNPVLQLQILMKTNEDLDKSLKLAGGRIQQLETELASVSQENTQLKASFRNMKSTDKEIEQLRAENLKLNSDIEQVLISQEQFTKIFPELQQQLVYKDKLIQDKNTECNKFKDQVAKLKRELEDLRTREQSYVSELESQSKLEARYRSSYPAEVEISSALKSPTIESRDISPQKRKQNSSYSSSSSSSSSDSSSINTSSNHFMANTSYEQASHSYGAKYDMSDMISNKPAEEAIVNEDLFRVCCLSDKGVLYDDDFIQVGIQILAHGNQARAQIYIGNKSAEKITRLETEVVEYPEDGIAVQINQAADESEYAQGTQANRVVLFNATSNFTRIPKLILKVFRGSVSKTYTLKLPVTIARFMKNTSIPPSELLNIWDELTGKENSQVISELAPWLKSLSEMVFGLRLGGSVDVHGSWDIEGLEQGVILAVTQKDEMSILARIEINAEKRMANLRVRSKGLKLRDTIMILLAEQLSGRTLTI